MKTPKQEQFDDFLMDESDEFLMKMTEELKQDLSDINVSEDLIARTLVKVSAQTKDTATKAEPKVVPINDIKAPVKYRRSFQWIKPLSVAVAACFIIFIGVNVAKNGLLGAKKDSASESKAYKMEVSDTAGDVKTQAKQDQVLKSANAGETNMEEPSTGTTATEESVAQSEVALVAPDTTAKEAADTQDTQGNTDEIFTTAKTNAYNRALDQANKDASDPNSIYVFDQSNEDISAPLLTLLTSDELGVTTEEAVDEWKYYFVFSLGEEDAVTYQIGKSKFVIATTYHGEDEPSEVTYQMKNTDSFLETITGYLKQ